MTNHHTGPTPLTTTRGLPGFLLAAAQLALFGVATWLCWVATTHSYRIPLLGLSILLTIAAVARPDSLAAGAWLLTIGAWWATDYSPPSLQLSLAQAVTIGTAHYLTAIRANHRWATRLSGGYLGRIVAVTATLAAVTTAAYATLRGFAPTTLTDPRSVVAWTAAALTALAALAIAFSQPTAPPSEPRKRASDRRSP